MLIWALKTAQLRQDRECLMHRGAHPMHQPSPPGCSAPLSYIVRCSTLRHPSSSPIFFSTSSATAACLCVEGVIVGQSNRASHHRSHQTTYTKAWPTGLRHCKQSLHRFFCPRSMIMYSAPLCCDGAFRCPILLEVQPRTRRLDRLDADARALLLLVKTTPKRNVSSMAQ